MAVTFVHEQWAGGEQDRFGQTRARAHAQVALAGGATVTRRTTVATESLAGERLVHHPKDRLAKPCQRDQRTPLWHAADEGLRAVDRIKHPDVLGIGAFLAEFLTENAVVRKRLSDQRAHCCLRGAVGS